MITAKRNGGGLPKRAGVAFRDIEQPIPRSSGPSRHEIRPEPRSRGAGSLLMAVCTVVLALALFGVSAQKHYLLGQIAAVVAGPLTLYGLWRGAMRKLLTLGAFVGACYVVADTGAVSGPSSGGALPTASANALLPLVCVPVAVVVAALIGQFLHRTVLARRPVALGIDRLLGAVVGLAEAALMVLPLCWISTMVQPAAYRVRDMSSGDAQSTQARVAGVILQLGNEASSGPVGELTRATNLIANIPFLKKMIDDLNENGRANIGDLPIDPALLEKLRELLPAGVETEGGASIVEQLRRQAESRNAALRQAPPPSEPGP